MTNLSHSSLPDQLEKQLLHRRLLSSAPELFDGPEGLAPALSLDHDVLEKINEVLRKSAVGLQFSYHSENGYVVAVVVDTFNHAVVHLEPEGTAELITSLGKLPALLKSRIILKKWCESREALAQCGTA